MIARTFLQFTHNKKLIFNEIKKETGDEKEKKEQTIF